MPSRSVPFGVKPRTWSATSSPRKPSMGSPASNPYAPTPRACWIPAANTGVLKTVSTTFATSPLMKIARASAVAQAPRSWPPFAISPYRFSASPELATSPQHFAAVLVRAIPSSFASSACDFDVAVALSPGRGIYKCLLLERLEFQIIAGAGDFTQLPLGAQFGVKSRSPRLEQGLGIRDNEVDLQVIAIRAPEPLGDVHFGAVRMSQSVDPGFFVKANGVHHKCGVVLPPADRRAHPGQIRIRRQRPAVGINPPHRVVVFIKHQLVFRRVDELKGIRMEVNSGCSRRIAFRNHGVIRCF